MTTIHPMLCTPVPNYTKICLPGWVSEKLNGIRAIWNPQAGAFQTRHGKFWRPWMTSKIWNGLTPPKLPLDGEFYVRGKSLQYLTRAASVNLIDDPGLPLEYHVYDCITDCESTEKRLKRLELLMPTLVNNIVLNLQHEFVDTAERLEQVTAQYRAAGGEGLVSRTMGSVYARNCRSPFMQKLKFMESQEVTVIGFHEGKGKFAGTLGAMTVRNKDGLVFRCGGGTMTNTDRDNVWHCQEDCSGKQITIEYPYLSEDGVPLQAGFVAWRDYE